MPICQHALTVFLETGNPGPLVLPPVEEEGGVLAILVTTTFLSISLAPSCQLYWHLLVNCIGTFLLTGALVSGLLQCLPLGEGLHAQMSKRRKNPAILNVVFLCVTT